MIGDRPFLARDKSANFWPLAIASMGESWHNSHHADPTCARHGVRRGQIDISARLVWLFEKAGWASHVRWPVPERLERKRGPDHRPGLLGLGGLERDQRPARPGTGLTRRALFTGRFTTRRARRGQSPPIT